ncbi:MULTISPECIES: YybH family protein [unclassified Paraburkholderia]|uniref:YybH family protein n=1 Tax=unclassified Paraburkholderia TaxID=2615204 RepID=UPI0038B80AED
MRIQKTLVSFFAVVILAAANATAYAAATHRFTEKDRQEVKDVFLRQAAAATAHDIVAFERVLASAPAGQPDPIAFVARAYQFWGKPALIEHFKETFKGVWKFEPNVESIKIVPLTADVAQLYAPTQITLGASEASARSAPFLVYEVAVRTPEGWRIASIVPVPAPAQ